MTSKWTKMALLFAGGAFLMQLGALGGCIAQWAVDELILRWVN